MIAGHRLPCGTLRGRRRLTRRCPPQTCRWNFTPAPGWTKEEAQILKLCLMKQGIGRWVQILETGLLPGKLIQQLNGQTQRLLGQQSLAAYTGLQVDIDAIRADNDKLVDAERKNGLVINSGREFRGRGSRRHQRYRRSPLPPAAVLPPA